MYIGYIRHLLHRMVRITCNSLRVFYAMVIVEEMHRKRDYVPSNFFLPLPNQNFGREYGRVTWQVPFPVHIPFAKAHSLKIPHEWSEEVDLLKHSVST